MSDIPRRPFWKRCNRISAGAAAVRDMIVEAWLNSVNTPVGYPVVNVRDIESGKVRATRELFGAD